MDRFWNTSLAALAAFVLTVGSIGVTVPTAQAAAPAAFALPAIA